MLYHFAYTFCRAWGGNTADPILISSGCWIDRTLARRQAAGHGSAAWESWKDVAKTLRTYQVTTGLKPGKVYTFEVSAVNNQNNAGPAAQAKTGTAPDKPANLTADAGFRQVVLSWDNPG